MDANVTRSLVITIVAYMAGLVVALVAGSDNVKVAVIAVGGTAVGALAGLTGSLAGARSQAIAAHEAADQPAMANLALKRTELDPARDQVLLVEQLRWASKAYDELEALLDLSRKLGTSIKKL
jgi:hypothetical protein